MPLVCDHLALKKAPSVLMPLVSTLPSALSTAVFLPPYKQRRDNTLDLPYLCWMARGIPTFWPVLEAPFVAAPHEE